ncbi:universal stress protein [Haloferax namakaokahaiae]|uniref:Universal stress protein n=1 Tax=Haloferax namakaokahaiae TaxID=1748331 RepID=A0ABD5ZBC1_9EURY
MATHILVPVDGSEQSIEALRFAATEWPRAKLTLLNVINPSTAKYTDSAFSGSEEWYQKQKRKATETFAQVKADASLVDTDRDISTRIAVGKPAKTIVEVLEADDYDHVVVGSHSRTGVSRVILGSVAEAIVRDSPVPVTVVR